MKILRNVLITAVSTACALILTVSAFGQTVSQNTKTDVVDIAEIVSTDRLSEFKPPASSMKSEPTVTSKSVAKPDPSNPSPQWHFEIRPYLWLAGIDGVLRVNNTVADTSKSSGDVLGALDFAMAAQVEAIHGNWRLMFDENYVNLGTTGTGPIGLVTLDVQPTMNIFEFGGSYTAVAVPNKNSTDTEPLPPAFTAEILGGVRWFHLGLGLQANNNPGVEGSRNLIGAFFGNRFKASPHKAITFIGKYTLGSSGSGGGFAWSAEGLVDLRLKRSFSIAGGYRALDLKANQPANTVGFDGQLRGLVLYMTLYR